MTEELKPGPPIATRRYTSQDALNDQERIRTLASEFAADEERLLRMTRYLFGTDIPDPTAPGIYKIEDADGAAVYFVRHPRPPFWQRLWFWLFPARLHADALEAIEIDLPEDYGP